MLNQSMWVVYAGLFIGLEALIQESAIKMQVKATHHFESTGNIARGVAEYRLGHSFMVLLKRLEGSKNMIDVGECYSLSNGTGP
jgi:hypothetical protein